MVPILQMTSLEVYICCIRSVFCMQTESFLAKYTPNSNSFLYLCVIFLKQNVMIDEKILKELISRIVSKNHYCIYNCVYFI